MEQGALTFYPPVLSEDETIERAVGGESIARYGDGELRLCVGGLSRSQRPSPRLVRELRDLLRRPSRALVCIPNIRPPHGRQLTPRRRNWRDYREPRYTDLYKLPVYGSAFISRPDSAPWIDRPDYWGKVRELWEDRDVTLVWEDRPTADLSLTPEMLRGAINVREVRGPALDAYEQIDRIEAAIGTPTGTVLLCLGACATVLAARLADKGVHAVDVGHVGTFMPKGLMGVDPAVARPA